MNQSDKKLWTKAKKLKSTEWYKAEEMINLAESETLKKQLRDLSIRLHHNEEYMAGLL